MSTTAISSSSSSQSLPEVSALPAGATSSASASSERRPSRAKVLLPVLAFLALSGSTVAYAVGHGKESTDDAQVEGHVANVATRVGGQVLRVLVEDNQVVKAGDLLVELDSRDYDAKLSAAKADLAAAKAQLVAAQTQLAVTEHTVDSNLRQARGGIVQASASFGSSRSGIEQAKADITAAESRRNLARIELARSQTLYDRGAVAKAELDSKDAMFAQADAVLAQSRARLTSALAGVENSSGNMESARGRLIAAESGPAQLEAAKAQVGVAQAHVEQAEAAATQAQLNASYTQVRAAVGGVVSRRSVEPGQMVSPDRPLMALVPVDDVWVVANFKEDQITEMNPGQHVNVKIDAYGSRAFSGHVESLAAGTGSRFALLPADNASGNFTKVVQRVPILVRLDNTPAVPLRPGMSAFVTVVTTSR